MVLSYRPEIDGLRGIAVLAVVLYHAELVFFGVPFFQGGFVGVDVFFVISGYLITRIIIRDMSEDNFSFLHFYDRRSRRILPALFTVMIVTIPFAWVLMLPKALKEYSWSVLSAVLFSSNFWFWQQDTYTAEPSLLKPFLHTWTLSVEEQFYICFPILLLILFRDAKSHISSFIIGLACFSLLLAFVWSGDYNEATFYLLPTRGWELMAGAIMGKIELNQLCSSSKINNQRIPLFGLLILFATFFLFHDEISYLVVFTVVPVIGTMLLIWFARGNGIAYKILAFSPLRQVGLISYSLYLWHFPIFAFARIYLNTISFLDKFICIILALILSTLTYIYVEKPVRKREFGTKPLILLLVVLLFPILIFNTTTIRTSGKNALSHNYLEKAYMDSEDHSNDMRSKDCFVSGSRKDMSLFDNDACMAIDRDMINVLLIGDSMPAYYWSGIHENNKNINLLQNTVSGCRPLIGDDRSKRACKERNDDFLSFIVNPDIGVLILSAFWELEHLESLEKTLLLIKEQNKEAILIGPSLRFNKDLTKIVIDDIQDNISLWNRILLKFSPERAEVFIPQKLVTPKNINDYMLMDVFVIEEQLRQLSQRIDVQYLSLLDQVCKGDVAKDCSIYLGDNILIGFDKEHATQKAAKILFSDFLIRGSLNK